MAKLLRYVRQILMLTVVVVILIIVLQNTESVETRLLFVKLEMPRAVLLFGALATGFAMGVVVAGWIMSRRKSSG